MSAGRRVYLRAELAAELDRLAAAEGRSPTAALERLLERRQPVARDRPVSVYLPEPMIAAARTEAGRLGVSLSALIRGALADRLAD